MPRGRVRRSFSGERSFVAFGCRRPKAVTWSYDHNAKASNSDEGCQKASRYPRNECRARELYSIVGRDSGGGEGTIRRYQPVPSVPHISTLFLPRARNQRISSQPCRFVAVRRQEKENYYDTVAALYLQWIMKFEMRQTHERSRKTGHEL
jgi:hypothetical protein